jgi:carbon-monoxide dehydrogenase large subunit
VVLEQARDKLAQIAAQLLHCPAEDIVFEEGRVRSRQSPGRGLEFSQVAAAAHNEELLPPGGSVGLEFDGSFTLPHSVFGFAAHVAVVEVDPDTGEIKIIHYAAVHDCGRIINPMLVDGQVHGAIAQGVGQALTEAIVYSAEGQPITGSLMDYGLPLASEFPNMILDSIETPSPLNPLGAKGVGELPSVAAPVAVTNAVLDALASAGVRHLDAPLTPEKVWRALQSESP